MRPLITKEIIEHHKQQEVQRIRFLIQRDGMDLALAFVEQTFKLYREALKARKYGKEFRVPLLCSCVILRQILRAV